MKRITPEVANTEIAGANLPNLEVKNSIKTIQVVTTTVKIAISKNILNQTSIISSVVSFLLYLSIINRLIVKYIKNKIIRSFKSFN